MTSEHKAKLILHNLPTMSDLEVKDSALWLRTQAAQLIRDRKQGIHYSSRFVARLF